MIATEKELIVVGNRIEKQEQVNQFALNTCRLEKNSKQIYFQMV